MANELKFGNKVIFLNGLPLTLPVATSDPGSAAAGDLYYNSTDTVVKYYNGSAWAALATGGAAANTALSNLSSVAINTSLLPGTDNSINLGSALFSWASGYVHALKDASDVVSVDLYGRALKDSAGTSQLAWSTSGVALSQLTATTVPYLNASKILTSSAVTPTELGFLSGVTSAIQTQLNAKQATGNYITDLTGDVVASGPGSAAATIANLAVTNAKIANATINLTTKVTGVLPVANGGTNKSSWTAGNVVFAGASGTSLSEDSTSQFTWDDTNKLFHVGAPGQSKLNVTNVTGTRSGMSVWNTTSNNALQVFNQSAWTLSLNNAANSAISGATINGAFSRGTLASPTQSLSGDQLFSLSALGYTGSVVGPGLTCAISFLASENTTSSGNGGELVLSTTPNGALIPVERMRLKNGGAVNIAGLTASLPVKTNASKDLISGAINLASAEVTGTLAIANGGTNSATSLNNNRVMQSSGGAIVEAAAITAARALISDANGIPTHSTVTSTELGFLSGVTSSVQTQLNAKAADNIVIKKDGSVAWTANQSLGGFKITNSADPSSAQDLATKAYVDAVANGLKPKAACRVGTTANISLSSAPASIDGVTLASGDRVLVKNQSSASANGIYVYNGSGSAMTRASDFDSLSPIDEINGAYTFLQEGTQAGQGWVETGTVATLGTDPINFVYFNSVSSLVGGDMINVVGSTISVDLATASGLESTNPGNNAGQLRIKLEASNPSLKFTGSNELAAKLDPAGAITSGASGLIVGVDGSTLEINTNALRVKAGGISNSHIAAAAAIALTKLAATTANRALASDGSGFIVASATTDTELGFLSGVTSSVQTQLNGKANTALSNLASTAVNTDILPSADLVRNLGSAILRWTNVFAGTIDGGSNSLTIKTSGGNGSLVHVANGTGTFDIAATKLRRSVNGADTTNYMEDQYFDSLTLAANTAVATEISSSLSFAVASFDSAVIEYKIKEATSNKLRVGQFIVTSDGTVASASDQFSETAAVGNATGLSLSADVSGGNVRILYNNTNASNAATMRCHIRRFRA